MNSHYTLFPLRKEIRIFLLATSILLFSAFGLSTIRMDAVLLQGGSLYVPMYSFAFEGTAFILGVSLLTLVLGDSLTRP